MIKKSFAIIGAMFALSVAALVSRAAVENNEAANAAGSLTLAITNTPPNGSPSLPTLQPTHLAGEIPLGATVTVTVTVGTITNVPLASTSVATNAANGFFLITLTNAPPLSPGDLINVSQTKTNTGWRFRVIGDRR